MANPEYRARMEEKERLTLDCERKRQERVKSTRRLTPLKRIILSLYLGSHFKLFGVIIFKEEKLLNHKLYTVK